MLSSAAASSPVAAVYLPFLAERSAHFVPHHGAGWFWFAVYTAAMLVLAHRWPHLSWGQRLRSWGAINIGATAATVVMYTAEGLGLRAAGYPVLAPYMATGFLWAFAWSPALPALLVTSIAMVKLRARLVPPSPATHE